MHAIRGPNQLFKKHLLFYFPGKLLVLVTTFDTTRFNQSETEECRSVYFYFQQASYAKKT
jgi:hypothetical protein